jgi:hypothetical protein
LIAYRVNVQDLGCVKNLLYHWAKINSSGKLPTFELETDCKQILKHTFNGWKLITEWLKK